MNEQLFTVNSFGDLQYNIVKLTLKFDSYILQFQNLNFYILKSEEGKSYQKNVKLN